LVLIRRVRPGLVLIPHPVVFGDAIRLRVIGPALSALSPKLCLGRCSCHYHLAGLIRFS
jgi:hypothetical protein